MQGIAPAFALAAHSSHHSQYHHFLLGADPAVIAPIPKPRCLGSLREHLGGLTGDLNLQRWRRLYHASFPWRSGFSSEHYDPGPQGAHRRLPAGYGRPERTAAAYDFVLKANPAFGALALVAGDRRLIDAFGRLVGGFVDRLEGRMQPREGPPGTRLMLAGVFTEPNDRWFMPLLHAHVRVLNFSSHIQAPRELAPIDHTALCEAGRSAGEDWQHLQAQALREAGYPVIEGSTRSGAFEVQGVVNPLLRILRAPQDAVAAIVERLILGGHARPAGWLEGRFSAAALEAVSEQLSEHVARAVHSFRPPKLGIPSEGPWRGAVREYARTLCPEGLSRLDTAADRAGATRFDAPLFAAGSLDAAHQHGPSTAQLRAPVQMPGDPEWDTQRSELHTGRLDHPWLASVFARELDRIRGSLVRGLDAPQAGVTDTVPAPATPHELFMAEEAVERMLGRCDLRFPGAGGRDAPLREVPRLDSLEMLLRGPSDLGKGREHTHGGRHL